MKILMNTLMLIFISVNFGMTETPFLWGQETVLTKQFALRQQALKSVTINQQEFNSENIPGKKSIKKAVLFSALVPGAGEFYAKSYLKSAIFLAAEVGAWAVNISYTRKGDDKDAEFKNFAGQHWSEYRYWSYVNYYAINNLGYSADELFPLEQRQSPDGGQWYLIPENLYEQNRQEIVQTLREIERTAFSHRLPSTKTQQYYEMIGKYPHQFGNAWSDATFSRVYSGPDKITSRNDFYMEMREESNRLYNIAQYGLMVALVNHVVSAIDAGFTARSYNQDREMKMEMSYDNYYYKGEYLNMLGLDVKW